MLAPAVEQPRDREGAPQERLSSTEIGALVQLRPDDLPGEARAHFETAVSALTAQPQMSEGRIAASLDAMSEDEAVAVASHLYRALVALTR